MSDSAAARPGYRLSGPDVTLVLGWAFHSGKLGAPGLGHQVAQECGQQGYVQQGPSQKACWLPPRHGEMLIHKGQPVSPLPGQVAVLQ